MNIDGTSNCPVGYLEKLSNRNASCVGFECDISTTESIDFSTCCCPEGEIVEMISIMLFLKFLILITQTVHPEGVLII